MDISTQPCHRVKNASHDSTPLTQKTIQEKKTKMRKSIDWKVGIFGLIALTLTLGLFSGSALAITGRVTSGTVIAGSSGNTITLRITLLGDELNRDVTVTPPDGWSDMATSGVGLTTVTGGTFTIVSRTEPESDGINITPNQDATTITVVYGSGGGTTNGVTVGNKIGLTEFTFESDAGTPSVTDLIVVTVDGSGTVEMTEGTQQNVVKLDESAGVTGRNFEFLYTAVSSTITVTEQNVDTVTEQNVDTLDGGELTLQIPAGWPAPTHGNITVETPDPDGDDGLTPTMTPLAAGSVGIFSISGSGPWTISVPITGLDGQQQIKIKYNNITVPFTIGTFQFPASVRGPTGALTPISVATDSRTLEINVAVAGRGSGTMTVSGGPVSAGSTRNTLEFIYSPAGSLDGGGLELVPPLAVNGDPLWTEPQGAPGSAGYTTVWIKPAGTASFVLFTAGHGSVNFGEDKGEKRPDFTGKGIGILFNRLKVGDRIRIVYGDGGGNNGATAPMTTGLSFFDVFVAPSFSDDALPIGNADGNAGEAKFENQDRPYVSIQSGDGIGTVTIADLSGDRETFAGEKESLTFTFEADAPMNGGFFSVTVDASWPYATNANTQVTTTGSTQPPLFLQREVRVPIVFLSGTQTITITYGKDADNRVDAPGIPETSVFVFKSQGTSGGILAAIPDPSAADADPRAFEVKVDQARDGSGIVTIPDAEKKATAGATGKTFNITYTAVGQMDGGQLQVVSPRGWTKMQEDSVSHIAIQASAGAQVTFDEFDSFDDGGGSEDDRAAVYDITTLRRDQTVTFIYSNVEVQSTRSNNDGLNNDGDVDENNIEITDEDDEPTVIEVFSRGKSDTSNALMVVADTTAKVVIDSALDGTGTGTITVTDREPNAKTIETDNVPAAHKVRLSIEYEAIGEIGKPSDEDGVDNNEDGTIDETGERAGGTVRVTIPTAFTTPVLPVESDNIDNDGDGNVDNETPNSEQIGKTIFSVSGSSPPPTLQIFGRVLTFEGVSLVDEEKLMIEIDNMDTPADASTYIFTIEVQGRPAVDADRSLVAIAPSPVVTTGNVAGGKGEAEILVPAKNDDDEHILIAGVTGATVTIEFKAVGPMDGGLVQVTIPNGWTIPQGTPGQAGYVTVVPESGVSIGQIGFTPGFLMFSIPIVTIRKDQKLTITYGAGGGASGITVSTTPTTGDGDSFLIQTQMPGAKPNHDETRFTLVSDLSIKVNPIEGSGSVSVSPTAAVKGATNNYRFQYTAAGNIGSISIRKPADGWPDFKTPQ